MDLVRLSYVAKKIDLSNEQLKPLKIQISNWLLDIIADTTWNEENMKSVIFNAMNHSQIPTNIREIKELISDTKIFSIVHRNPSIEDIVEASQFIRDDVDRMQRTNINLPAWLHLLLERYCRRITTISGLILVCLRNYGYPVTRDELNQMISTYHETKTIGANQ